QICRPCSIRGPGSTFAAPSWRSLTCGAATPADGRPAGGYRWAAMPFDSPAASAPCAVQMPANFRPLPELDEGWNELRPGPRLADMRARGEAFARSFRAEGPVRGFCTIDLLPFPYPVAFGF